MSIGTLEALVLIGIPLAGWLYRLDRHVQKALNLLTGHEETDGDGVIPRLDETEQRVDTHETALRREDILPVTDGGDPGGGDDG